MDSTKLSLQDRIDKLAIAYVQSHFDVKEMSVEDFVKEVANAQYAIVDYWLYLSIGLFVSLVLALSETCLYTNRKPSCGRFLLLGQL